MAIVLDINVLIARVDLYLLALAVRHRMAFATCDGSIPATRVVGGPAACVVSS